MRIIITFFLAAVLTASGYCQGNLNPAGNKILLNGLWEFEQTLNAFPPANFTRTCPVPGLVNMARPFIDDYQTFFLKPEYVENIDSHNLLELDYVPKYSWYRKKIHLPDTLIGHEAVLVLKKSQFVTQVFINGYDMGGSISCYTPIVVHVSKALKYGADNEILIRVGDRAWLPSSAAGSVDKEKVHYLPGIWDDVNLVFTGKYHLQDVLAVPSVKDSSVTVKLRVRSFYPSQVLYGDPMYDTAKIVLAIREKSTGKVMTTKEYFGRIRRDNSSVTELKLKWNGIRLWSPDSPFLYDVVAAIYDSGNRSDMTYRSFGMRDFTIDGEHFKLNGEKLILRGTNITLHRFFEDPDCGGLPWDRAWVRKMLIDIPKSLRWNAMRICVGIVPDFWYDLADENGIMFQNEWMYWQNHGWDEQVRNEYTDWVWSDGNHPSIVIWDAINENWDDYIGNKLIPELKILDPSRIWDAGYMTSEHMKSDEMDEPHPYRAGWDLMNSGNGESYFKQNPYLLGKLDNWPSSFGKVLSSRAPQLVNEYGWIWLWRDGRPSKLTRIAYDYLLGPEATPDQRRELQAYWLQLETEWLRAERSLAGVLAFCYLANNYGFTGDWFIDNIKDLKEGPALKWMKHSFAPTAVFIDLPDELYMPFMPSHDPGEVLEFNLACINDLDTGMEGKIMLKLINQAGRTVSGKSYNVAFNPFARTDLQAQLKLPVARGIYLIVAELETDIFGKTISRRYIKVGNTDRKEADFFKMRP
jgi:hypothetical protein